MILNWMKCSGDQWCNFFNLNIDHPHFNNLEGIYIIWHGAPNPAVVYVGQGNIRERIRIHRTEESFLHYRNNVLFVTWAPVSSIHRDGVERYLIEKWNPLAGDNHPSVEPIEVNSPW